MNKWTNERTNKQINVNAYLRCYKFSSIKTAVRPFTVSLYITLLKQPSKLVSNKVFFFKLKI